MGRFNIPDKDEINKIIDESLKLNKDSTHKLFNVENLFKQFLRKSQSTPPCDSKFDKGNTSIFYGLFVILVIACCIIHANK